MAGELSQAMLQAASQAMAMNSIALKYVADGFATEEEYDIHVTPLADMWATFDAHGHGADLRYCNEPFCSKARHTVRQIASQQLPQIGQAITNPQGGM